MRLFLIIITIAIFVVFSDGVSGYVLILIIMIVCEFCCFSGGVRGYVFNY